MTTARDGAYESGSAKWTPGQQRPIVSQPGILRLADHITASVVPTTTTTTATTIGSAVTALLADRSHADMVAETRRNTAIIVAGNVAGYWILVFFLGGIIAVLLWVLLNIARDYMFKQIKYDND